MLRFRWSIVVEQEIVTCTYTKKILSTQFCGGHKGVLPNRTIYERVCKFIEARILQFLIVSMGFRRCWLMDTLQLH